MALRYEIHPSIGIARVGNSPESFYLAPDEIGSLPIECDGNGNALLEGSVVQPVKKFKDGEEQVRRQGARFRLFVHDDTKKAEPAREVTLDDRGIRNIEWTVHLANKKACWYPFRVFVGDVMFPNNTYQDHQVGRRNPGVEGPARQKLIIDPGPRAITGRNQRVAISRDNIPADYPYGWFPKGQPPLPINGLGEIRTDAQGRLIVLGGYGHASGSSNIIGLLEGAGWHDDVSDGQVSCKLTLTDGTSVLLNAWVIVGAPKFAPELVNIITLDDIMFDVGVRSMGLLPELYESSRGWNPQYLANFQQDITPIFDRLAGYIWVANVPSMVRFANPRFDMTDASQENRPNRENLFRYFRHPGAQGKDNEQTLMSPEGVPLLPTNSSTNSFMNVNIDKFMALTETQYFLLSQWACGKFEVSAPGVGPAGVHPLDRASVGNCVGDPMGPGIECTWSTRNPVIYEKPYRIKPRSADGARYRAHGLSATEYDETISGEGCEPGDLTKRMSIPWQADFMWCTFQHVNFADPNVCVGENLLPVPPTYMVYWWPPQSPVTVISGAITLEEQEQAGVDAGTQVNFSRGISSYSEAIVAWNYLGFIVNQNHGADRALYPYFVETERNHGEFIVGGVAIGDVSNVLFATDTSFAPFWFLKRHSIRKKPIRLQAELHRGT
jgi:L-lysine 6-oxidase